ncbi:Uu.00g016650.m01.CDS01 [Anthostomella pinea]|uniref:Uu.00g016650.m01.CDS01 n=1 Tax=Anthostomella pinea TaxID=933095 RepID=A0AAI8VYS7_9PEZI|nr:Uu.00g016650.m01.CDS01 [Anthostomella pinea]
MPHLPNEILLCIFSFLRPNLRRKVFFDNCEQVALDDERSRQLTLSSICRASKLFRRLALPELYHTIPKTSAGLLRSLSRDVYLCDLVKAIDLTPFVSENALREAFEIARPRLRLPAEFGHRLLQDIDTAVGETNLTGESVLLVLLLPNLEAVEIRRGTEMLGEIFSGLLGQSRVPPLRLLRLRHWDTNNFMRIKDFQQLLLPTDETLQGCALGWEIGPPEPLWKQLPLMAPRLSLRHIDLTDTAIDEHGLNDLLSRCPDLQTLRIKLAIPQDMLVGRLEPYKYEDDEDDDFEPPLMLDQVLPDSLQRLRLLTIHDDEVGLGQQLGKLRREDRMTELRGMQMEGLMTRAVNESISVDVAEVGWTVRYERDKVVFTNDLVM